ncbi:hypothetical protein, partial [Mycoplasmoides pirum]|uniref:hypothetical protein n=1 Tax=Mycoplasmoides pirum TaxID=2122 RepID=UPI00138B1589
VPSKKYMNLTSKISNNPELYFVGSDNNTTTNGIFDSLVRPKDDNVTNLFYGQIQNKTSKATSNELGISYRYIKNQFGLNVYSNVQTVNRLELLGNGEFVNSLSNQLLTNGLSSILENISLSEITGNESDKATTVKVLKNQYVNEIYKINKAPNTTGLKPGASSVLIVASNVNLISQTVTLTAYSWNSLTQSYDVMPRSNSLEINQVNNSTFTGFSAMADWILPIVIAVPIVLVALIIGLGCGIGIPMAKHKKSIQVGFELQ